MSIDTTTPRAEDNRPGMLERPLSRVLRPDADGSRLRGRPDLYTAYKQDMALLNTPAKRRALLAVLAVAVAGVFVLPNDLVVLFSTAFAFCIGAIGLNIVTGYAGQVSLGHAFFVGVGAYTAAVVSGATDDPRLLGFGLSFVPIWLLASGLVTALVGGIVAPLALRRKGLYLAIVTLGLVLLGEHIFKEARPVTGGPGVGRPAAVPSFGGGEVAAGEVWGLVFLSRSQQIYLIILVVLVVLALLGRNLARSDLGRAFSAVRDRDIAASVIGVDLTRVKILAFVISSFYAGVCGALLYTVSGFVDPSSFNLLLSIRFIAMILIGGVATISGSIMGGIFVATLNRFSQEIVERLPSAIQIDERAFEGVMYGVLIVAFLVLEPRGLYGLWVRIRNYWKAWPFSY